MLCPRCLRQVPRFEPVQTPDGSRGLKCPLEGCGYSDVPLRYEEDYTDYPAVACSVVGLPGHGKTRYIDGLLKGLDEATRHWPDFTHEWLDQKTAAEVRARLREFQRGTHSYMTRAVFPQPVVQRLSGVPRVGGCQLVFFDTGGEVFLDPGRLRDAGQYVRHSPAIIWLASLREPPAEGEPPAPVEPADFTDMLTSYCEGLKGMGGDSRLQTAVFAVTKADRYLADPGFPAAAARFLKGDVFDPGRDPWVALEEISGELEAWLRQLGYQNVVNLLRKRFRQVYYCITSAQGREAISEEEREAAPGSAPQFEPKGVLAPLFWLWRSQRPAVWVEADGKRTYCPTLPQALAEAPAGATVRLDSGYHMVSAPLEARRDVTLVGAGRTATVVVSSAPQYVLGVSAGPAGVTVRDVQFVHRGLAPADVVRAVRGAVAFHECGMAGGRPSPDGRVTGCGVVAHGDTALTLTGCLVTDNVYGVRVAADRPAEVSQCRLSNNGGGGVLAEGRSGVRVSDSTLTANWHGLRAVGNARAELVNSRVLDGEKDGLSVTDAADVRVEGTEFAGHGKVAIRLKGSGKVEIVGNTVHDNKGFGILADGQAAGVVRGCQFTKNGRGVVVAEQATLHLDDNRFAGHAEHAASFHGEAQGELKGNEFRGTGQAAVYVDGDARPAILANAYAENAGGDVYLADTVHPSVDVEVTGQAPAPTVTDHRKRPAEPGRWLFGGR